MPIATIASPGSGTDCTIAQTSIAGRRPGPSVAISGMRWAIAFAYSLNQLESCVT